MRFRTLPGGPEETLAERMWRAVSDATSDQLVSPVWRRTECWRTPDFQGLANLAEGIGNAQQGIHEVVLGSPVGAVAGAAGVPAPAAGALTAVAAALPLPGDATVTLITTFVKVTGVVAGTALGQPMLANACVKSLAHDFTAHQVSRAIRTALEDGFGTCERETTARVARRTRTAEVTRLRHDLQYQDSVRGLHADIAVRSREAAPTGDTPQVAVRRVETARGVLDREIDRGAPLKDLKRAFEEWKEAIGSMNRDTRAARSQRLDREQRERNALAERSDRTPPDRPSPDPTRRRDIDRDTRGDMDIDAGW